MPIFTKGCFDLLCTGHIDLFRRARTLGDRIGWAFRLLLSRRHVVAVRILWTIPGLIWDRKEFKYLLNQIKGQTGVGKKRCFWIWLLGKYAATKKGDMAEIGVYKGGTARIIAKSCPRKRVHLFDTFAGMPEVNSAIDCHKKGDFSDTSLELVSNFLSDCSNVVFHPGFFPGTAVNQKDQEFCFVYIDVDIYSSAKDCLNFFYNKLTPGGVIVFDDYKSRSCSGIKMAIDEFFSDKPERPIETAEYQCALIKL
jgi:O-methyltransferase